MHILLCSDLILGRNCPISAVRHHFVYIRNINDMHIPQLNPHKTLWIPHLQKSHQSYLCSCRNSVIDWIASCVYQSTHGKCNKLGAYSICGTCPLPAQFVHLRASFPGALSTQNGATLFKSQGCHVTVTLRGGRNGFCQETDKWHLRTLKSCTSKVNPVRTGFF